jgi:hypothetical protein
MLHPRITIVDHHQLLGGQLLSLINSIFMSIWGWFLPHAMCGLGKEYLIRSKEIR